MAEALVCLGATAAGAWFGIIPFLKEHAAAVRLTETEGLTDAVTHMKDFVIQAKDLRLVQDEIARATGHWQGVQEQANRSVTAAQEIADRLQHELTQFTAFIQKTQDAEKNHLRLEIEKLRRGERDWLQAVVLILDHVFALHQAASRSGQPGLIAQLNQFQFACRDAVRRVGLVAFAPTDGDAFDCNTQQLEPGAAPPSTAAKVGELLATGFTYQGELVRRALVRLRPAADP
jgi:molecular chaperone GrpE (heat shock protein)